jgi:hypothetical protein
MRHGHAMPVDRIGDFAGRGRATRIEMGDDLVPEKVEISPRFRASSLLAAEETNVKVTGGGQIVNRKG